MNQMHDEGLFKPIETVKLLDVKWVPSRTSQITNLRAKIATKLMNSIMKLIENLNYKAPGIDNYPGDFEKNPNLMSNIELNLTSNKSNTLDGLLFTSRFTT